MASPCEGSLSSETGFLERKADLAELGFVLPEEPGSRQVQRPDSAYCQQAPAPSVSPAPLLVPCCPFWATS